MNKNMWTKLVIYSCFSLCICSVQVHFILADGSRQSVDAKVGDNLLDVIIDKDIDVDGFGEYRGTICDHMTICHIV